MEYEPHPVSQASLLLTRDLPWFFMSCSLECHITETSSSPQAFPTSSTGLLRMTAMPTPLLRPLQQPNPVASLPVSSPTAQPTRPIQRLVSISCSADVKMINPAHAQLLSATTLPFLRPTALTTSFKSACRPVAKSVSVLLLNDWRQAYRLVHVVWWIIARKNYKKIDFPSEEHNFCFHILSFDIRIK